MKKNLTPQEVLIKAQKYCAYQERSHQEVRDKLYTFGLYKNAVEQIISELISDDFLNEERFARAYARGKFRIKRWGRNKIKNGLFKKHTSEYCIKKGLTEIDEQEYQQTLKELIEKKKEKLLQSKGSKKEFEINKKIAAYCMQKGYESNLVWEALKPNSH